MDERIRSFIAGARGRRRHRRSGGRHEILSITRDWEEEEDEECERSQIEVDTQPGEFTEFRIVLPRAAVFIAELDGRA